MPDEQEESLELEDAVHGEYIVPDEDFTEEPAETEEVPEKTEETQETPEKETIETSPPAETQGKYAGWTREQIEIELDRESKEKNRVAAELRKTITQQAAQKEPGALTRDQLVGIMREHQDDPEKMFQLVDYIASEHVKQGKADTIDAIKLSETKAKTDDYVAKNYGDLLTEGSAAHTYAQTLKEELGITNHPHADFIVGNAMVAMNHQKTVEEQYKRGLNEGQGKSVEKNRKKGIKEGKLESSTSNGKSTPIVSSDLEKNADIIGLTGKARTDYFNMMKGKGGA